MEDLEIHVQCDYMERARREVVPDREYDYVGRPLFDRIAEDGYKNLKRFTFTMALSLRTLQDIRSKVLFDTKTITNVKLLDVGLDVGTPLPPDKREFLKTFAATVIGKKNRIMSVAIVGRGLDTDFITQVIDDSVLLRKPLAFDITDKGNPEDDDEHVPVFTAEQACHMLKIIKRVHYCSGFFGMYHPDVTGEHLYMIKVHERLNGNGRHLFWNTIISSHRYLESAVELFSNIYHNPIEVELGAEKMKINLDAVHLFLSDTNREGTGRNIGDLVNHIHRLDPTRRSDSVSVEPSQNCRKRRKTTTGPKRALHTLK